MCKKVISVLCRTHLAGADQDLVGEHEGKEQLVALKQAALDVPVR
jgi:hypothetical protein